MLTITYSFGKIPRSFLYFCPLFFFLYKQAKNTYTHKKKYYNLLVYMLFMHVGIGEDDECDLWQCCHRTERMLWLKWKEPWEIEEDEKNERVYEIQMKNSKSTSDDWTKTGDIDMKSVTMDDKTNNEKEACLKMEQSFVERDKYQFRIRIHHSPQMLSDYSNVVGISFLSELYQIPISVAKYRKFHLSYSPENLCKQDDSVYRSALNNEFNGNEPDWIVFEISGDTKILHLTHVYIRCRGDTQGVKEMKVEWSEKNNDNEWLACQPNPINVQQSREMQMIELTCKATPNGIKFIKISFLNNWGQTGAKRIKYDHWKIITVFLLKKANKKLQNNVKEYRIKQNQMKSSIFPWAL
ncbi:hypothetical protein RFI_24981 [Reticulomyxa filosa]|uniref:Uncharacterized protein n=1 Tax=Reticulomyxa filosa TaxID=46433 RepID=X6MG73_RETFI|nr:hypothetical protein RFI_24981 [Reticulomyxa filosa]|eukprot:ETO12397.1 hypothetical protein RFI_24981 [Reticulomyxa filosa]